MESTTNASEPIFWTSTQPNYSEKDRTRYRMENGKRIKEKIPQTGHIGTHEAYQKAAVRRFHEVVRHDGHMVFSVLTNGAAHLDVHGPYGQYIVGKRRSLGWFGMGECPCALVAANNFGVECLVDEKNRGARPCEPGTYSAAQPCPHAVAEIAARRAAHNAIMHEKEIAGKTDQNRLLEGQNKLIEMLAAQAVKDDPPPVEKKVPKKDAP